MDGVCKAGYMCVVSVLSLCIWFGVCSGGRYSCYGVCVGCVGICVISQASIFMFGWFFSDH